MSRTRPCRGRRLPRLAVALGLLVAGLLVVGTPAAGQLIPAGNGAASFTLDLSNPGARSLGMGGAFSGLADDATAAFANPAGLTILTRPEISVELRRWEYSVPFVRLAIDVEPQIFLRSERIAVVDGESTKPSFLSYVYPLGRFTLALYRHQLASFDSGLDGTFTGSDGLTLTLRSKTTLDLRGIGVAGAFRLNDTWSIGANTVRYDCDLRSRQQQFIGHDSSYDEQRVDDRDIGFGLGVQWRTGRRWSAGAFYRSALDFAVAGTVSRVNTDEYGSPPGRFRLVVPESYGLGVAWRPRQAAVFTVDLSRLLYSQTAETFRSSGASLLGKYVADDVVEVRAGFEYSLWRLRWIPAFRLGAWYEPDHKIRFEPKPGLPNLATAPLGIGFERGEGQLHWTAGFGIVLADRLQLDAAADFADTRDTVSLSGVFRF